MTEQESLLSAISEDVTLQAHDPSWPLLFAAERNRLLSLFRPTLIDVQHIDSTAVPCLVAKPIIDILAGVGSIAVAESLANTLCASGYTTSPEFNAALTDRKWFMRWANGRRTHHLHLVVYGGTVWRERLRFRDALLSDSQLVARYAALKAGLATRHVNDREAYTDAKGAFIRSVVDA